MTVEAHRWVGKGSRDLDRTASDPDLGLHDPKKRGKGEPTATRGKGRGRGVTAGQGG
jgi:hypothetical protein